MSPAPLVMDLHQLTKLQEGYVKSVVNTLGLVSTEYPEKIHWKREMWICYLGEKPEPKVGFWQSDTNAGEVLKKEKYKETEEGDKRILKGE